MIKICVGYTLGKKTKNKRVFKINFEIQHGYSYKDLRDKIKTKKGIKRKIHIVSVREKAKAA